jgi:hypothetical protein
MEPLEREFVRSRMRIPTPLRFRCVYTPSHSTLCDFLSHGVTGKAFVRSRVGIPTPLRFRCVYTPPHSAPPDPRKDPIFGSSSKGSNILDPAKKSVLCYCDEKMTNQNTCVVMFSLPSPPHFMETRLLASERNCLPWFSKASLALAQSPDPLLASTHAVEPIGGRAIVG